MIKPADKLKVFANLAFMDSLKSGVSDETGLVIRESEIDTEHEGETYRDGEIIRPKFGELYAILRSEELGIDIPVYWGSNAELLEHGACHASSSVLAGQKGNSVISAHVDTYFADLDKLKKAILSRLIPFTVNSFIRCARKLLLRVPTENMYLFQRTTA